MSLFEATQACLDYSEENGINVVEIVIEPQSFLRGDLKKKFIEFISLNVIN